MRSSCRKTQADGVYMLWRSGDLQPTMADAKRIFSQSDLAAIASPWYHKSHVVFHSHQLFSSEKLNSSNCGSLLIRPSKFVTSYPTFLTKQPAEITSAKQPRNYSSWSRIVSEQLCRLARSYKSTSDGLNGGMIWRNSRSEFNVYTVCILLC